MSQMAKEIFQNFELKAHGQNELQFSNGNGQSNTAGDPIQV